MSSGYARPGRREDLLILSSWNIFCSWGCQVLALPRRHILCGLRGEMLPLRLRHVLQPPGTVRHGSHGVHKLLRRQVLEERQVVQARRDRLHPLQPGLRF